MSQSALLHDDVLMPMLGLGTSKIRDGHEMNSVVRWGVEAGYRLIDTATIYGNERGVGEAVRQSEVDREDLFITTKLWNTDHGYEQALTAFSESLDLLQLEYVDLYLIHWPQPDQTAVTWSALEHLKAQGLVRAIGVSNFEVSDLDQLMTTAEVPPAVNQMECHPTFQQRELRAACAAIGTVPQAWSPLRRGTVLSDPVVARISDRVGRTPAQVILRAQIQEAIATIPKSVTQSRIAENGALWDFSLSADDLESLRSLDDGSKL